MCPCDQQPLAYLTIITIKNFAYQSWLIVIEKTMNTNLKSKQK